MQRVLVSTESSDNGPRHHLPLTPHERHEHRKFISNPEGAENVTHDGSAGLIMGQILRAAKV